MQTITEISVILAVIFLYLTVGGLLGECTYKREMFFVQVLKFKLRKKFKKFRMISQADFFCIKNGKPVDISIDSKEKIFCFEIFENVSTNEVINTVKSFLINQGFVVRSQTEKENCVIFVHKNGISFSIAVISGKTTSRKSFLFRVKII